MRDINNSLLETRRDALTLEGHDSRYITIAGGGHQNPKNAHDWQAGCLGISSPCSTACANSFTQCVNNESGPSDQAFKTCNAATSMAGLSGCTATCSPTLDMLSEFPPVMCWGPPSLLLVFQAQGTSAPATRYQNSPRTPQL